MALIYNSSLFSIVELKTRVFPKRNIVLASTRPDLSCSIIMRRAAPTSLLLQNLEEENLTDQQQNTPGGVNNTLEDEEDPWINNQQQQQSSNIICFERSAAFVRLLSPNDFNTLITLLLNLTICIVNLILGVINRSKPIIALTSVVLAFISVHLIIFMVSVYHKGILSIFVQFSSLVFLFLFTACIGWSVCLMFSS